MHTPEEVAASIKEIIKQKYGNLNAYAQEKNITPTQLYALLKGKEYLSLFSAFRFSDDFDVNIDYCMKGELPVLNPEHDYNMLLEAATDFFFAVRDEDKARDEFERKYDDLSSEEREQSRKYLEKLRIDKAKAGCALVDLLNKGWGEENPDDDIEKPVIPKSTMKLHEAIQEVIRQSGHPLTFTEIARQINAQELYTRKDGQTVPASQISARVKSYPQLFKVNSDVNPLTITLKI
ncbi:MAG: winged helix-turn-helix domain-containing protein [Bacteroidales bacterium]|nr:winged helix-turn-helix domain-containing protein [Bacteroidales bacterium]